MLEFLFNEAAAPPATLLKRGSDADVFLWNLQNFQEHLFYRTAPVDASVTTKPTLEW